MRPARHHLESLDAFRGLTIAGMILVNNPGSWDAVPPLLVHADWNGCTIADFVFPFFILIMGAAMPFAFSRRIAADAGGSLGRRIWRRAATLVALGLVLNAAAVAPALDQIRFPGVLQRIGLVYLLAAGIVRRTAPATRLVIAAVMLLGHWALLTLVPFGGHAAGLVLPGQNVAASLDRLVFGTHLLTPAGDPEGLLGTIPATASALLGSIAGDRLRAGGTARRQLAGLLWGGAAATALGLAWAMVWPINKPLWTGSYALVTAGLGAWLFAGCYALVDVAGRRTWARPLVWLGVNPLAIYFLAELAGHLLDRPWIPDGLEWTTAKAWVFWEVLEPALERPIGDAGASLAFAVGFVLLWVAVAGVLYRQNIRVQV
jgi:predicted acyltransferase